MLHLAPRLIQRQVSGPSCQSDPEHFQSQALMLDQTQMRQKQAFRKLRQHLLLEPGQMAKALVLDLKPTQILEQPGPD
jgi:hypothetical protein